MNICMLIVNKNRYSVVEYQYGVIKKKNAIFQCKDTFLHPCICLCKHVICQFTIHVVSYLLP